MPEDLVLLHGFTQTGASWDPVIRALGERYRALAPDLRGHGSAGAARPVDLPAVLADLEAVLPAGGAVLGGYSMGGRIALHAALALPERVRRLVLVGASPGLADPAERAARRRADAVLAERIEAIGIEAFAREWGSQSLFSGQTPVVVAAARTDRLRNTAAGLAAALRGLGTGTLAPLWDRLGELSQPVTLVVGERDVKFRALAGRMAGALPAGRAVVVHAAGHAAQLERPEAVARAIETAAG
jgi:2-succinyl-6-hydroxy-2,4-cyclohexadiene-1-carboxylate synthase